MYHPLGFVMSVKGYKTIELPKARYPRDNLASVAAVERILFDIKTAYADNPCLAPQGAMLMHIDRIIPNNPLSRLAKRHHH